VWYPTPQELPGQLLLQMTGIPKPHKAEYRIVNSYQKRTSEKKDKHLSTFLTAKIHIFSRFGVNRVAVPAINWLSLHLLNLIADLHANSFIFSVFFVLNFISSGTIALGVDGNRIGYMEIFSWK
jgi:hypothetical protein